MNEQWAWGMRTSLRNGCSMLSITIIQKPLDILCLRINFQHVSVRTINFSEEFGVWFFDLLAFLKTIGKDFSHKGGGGGEDKDIPGSPGYWLPYIRLSDCGDGAKGYEQKEEQRGLYYYYYCYKYYNNNNYYYYYYFIYLYFFHSFAVRLRDSPCVSPLRFRFLLFCIRSPEAWQLLKVAVSLKPVWWFSGQKKVCLYVLWILKEFGMHVIKPG